MWSLIIPNIIYTNNCIIMINGFRATPESLYEAAYLDGAGDFQVFVRIALPLAKATIASLALFYFMGHWNDFFTPMLYLNTASKMPLQVVLRNMLIEEQAIGMDPTASKLTPEGIKGAIIFITMVPVMIIYPFVQRFFVGGVMMDWNCIWVLFRRGVFPLNTLPICTILLRKNFLSVRQLSPRRRIFPYFFLIFWAKARPIWTMKATGHGSV